MKAPFRLFILSLLFLTNFGCGKHSGFQADEIPTEVARVEDLGYNADDEKGEFSEPEEKPGTESEPEIDKGEGDMDAAVEPETPDTTKPDDLNEPPQNKTEEQTKPNLTDPPTNPPASPPPSKKGNLWKSVVDIAKWVMKNEGHRVGKACNFYIQRVFELMGFGKASWQANDFDKYVKNNFESYKLKTFEQATHADNKKALETYIWSHPERTGFVFQWKRKSPHGHIAFVQRVQNNLIIYHASLNQFRPKSQLVNLDVLLHKGGRQNKLNVFSHFQNKVQTKK